MYYVTKNHESRINEYEKLREELINQNINLLENKETEIKKAVRWSQHPSDGFWIIFRFFLGSARPSVPSNRALFPSFLRKNGWNDSLQESGKAHAPPHIRYSGWSSLSSGN